MTPIGELPNDGVRVLLMRRTGPQTVKVSIGYRDAKNEILSALTSPQGSLELTPAEAGIHDPAPECEGEIAA